MADTQAPLQILVPPYRRFYRLSGSRRQLKEMGKDPGSALVWSLPTRRVAPEHLTLVRNRPGGLTLVVVLPPPSELPDARTLIEATEICRPAAVLPHQPDLSPGLVCEVLRQPSEELGADVVEYMRWRGLCLDRETAHLVRRTVELSEELRTVSALARSLYLSRRALGRRFLVRGLPVPSHWLHFARLLRVLLRLQASDASVLSVGFELGYPDGFALSNQMVRLTGVRPSQARVCLGWEWFMEAWLRTEAEAGGLRPPGSAGPCATSAREQGRRPAKQKSGIPDVTS
jgi:AraC-like DNA-binding protein